jgi:thioredoxin 1
MNMVTELTKKNLAELVEKSAKPVVVDVFAPWCGPCLQMAPLFEQLAEELGGTYTFLQLNVDEERELAIQYSVTSIPTFLFIHNNTVVGRETGYMSKETLATKIQEHLG